VAADGQIALVNTQAERLFGYQRAELIGQPVELLVPDAARAGRASAQGRVRHRPMGAGALNLASAG
jgi:PAS domain S-box-containing protein